MCFFVQTNHTRKELLFVMFLKINLRNHSSLHKIFYNLDNTRDTYGKVINGNNKFRTLLKPLRKAFTPIDFFHILFTKFFTY
ncbi:hypothetical protein IMAU30046_01725 [Lactobacillus helveticus]|nr:hypothetical protein [Lactobacillus helveticus]